MTLQDGKSVLDIDPLAVKKLCFVLKLREGATLITLINNIWLIVP